MSLLARRRAMMSPPEIKYRFIPGTYNSLMSGYSTTVNDDGSLTSDNWLCFNVRLMLNHVLFYKAGDVITFSQSTDYASLEGTRSIRLYGSAQVKILDSSDASNYASYSYTVAEDGYVDSVFFLSASEHQPGVTVKPQFSINGVMVIG